MTRFGLGLIFVLGLLTMDWPTAAEAAPSVADALELRPVQKGISYRTPTEAEVEHCTIKPEKVDGSTAWVVRGPDGNLLRQFADSDGDNVVDMWCYYQAGLEVYRDIDSDHNGKADEYRWFHGAGMRWGIDPNEDGKIDRWKLISAEECAEEVTEALRTDDAERFEKLLLTKQEIESLGLSEQISQLLRKRVQAASETFRTLVAAKEVEKDSEFRDFGGLRPGMVPAGTSGSTKDVLVYENVWAMVHNGDDHIQLQLGTMLNAKGAWKLVDGPSLGDSQYVTAGIFFVPGESGASEAAVGIGNNAPSERMQEIFAALEKLDQQLVSSKAADKPALNKKRAELLEALAESASTPSEKRQWYRQLADMVSAAAQDGSFPKGIDYLGDMEKRLAKQEESDDLVAYFQFHRMRAEHYGVRLFKEDVDYAEAQSEWLDDLEEFVDQHPQSEHGVEALRELALGSEMMGDEKDAVKWYERIANDYGDSSAALLAKGALIRLNCEGKAIRLQGTPVRGDKVDLRRYKGNAVVIQYWTTSCEVCKADHAVLKELVQKYRRRGLVVVGINLDYSRKDLLAYLKSKELPWPQLYEAGGFDSRYAKEMGVVTVPLLLLVGPDGKVVNKNIQAAEIEEQFKKILTRPRS